jgi:VWFA-related protein
MLSCSHSDSRLLVSLFAALCLLAPPTRVRAQDVAAPVPAQDEGEVVRINSELVQTDVMVFDKGGKFVDGLKAEQFELAVDGKPQAVSFFERIQAGAVDEDAQIAAARGLKSGPGGGAALPLDRGRTVIFFADDLHLSAGSSVHIRKTLLRFIDDEIGQNDEAAVISASGQVGFLQQFTDNKAVLRAAAARLNARPFLIRDSERPPMTETHALAIDRNDSSVVDYFVDALLRENPLMRREMAESMVRSRARIILQQSDNIAASTLATLESTVRSTAAMPGRKILFFISDGFLVDDRDGDLRDRMRRVTDAAARAGVVIYSLDAMGLRTNQPDASSDAPPDPSGRLASTNLSEGSTMQSPLFTLAADTGGRALVNTNALNRAVSGALKETALYYLLAWKPDSSEPAAGRHGAKFQHIEVSVKGRPELRVIVRRGFFNSPPPAEEQPRATAKKKKADEAKLAAGPQKSPAERDLSAALQASLPRAGLPTTLSLGYVNEPDRGVVLTASVEVDRAALAFEEGEKHKAVFDLLGVVLNDRGKAVSGFGQEINVSVGADTPPRQRVVYSYQFRLGPGLYQVRVAARDARSTRTGSAMQWVEVPDYKQGHLSLSSIFLGERTTDVHTEAVKPEELSTGVLLSVDRRFLRTSRMRFVTYIYNAASVAAAPPDVALQVQIFRDDQPVFTAPLSKVMTEGLPDASRIPYAAELALASFPAGRYVLQVTAIDRAAKTTASQRTSFVVE